MATAIIDELERLEGTIAATQERLMELARNAAFAEGEQWRAVVGRLSSAMFKVNGAKTLVWYLLIEKGEGDGAAD